ncbi:PEP-CTERM sorting domain-containing protein [Haloferula rosea]|uniref:PEP-CTERM sorting domain-containing protein n=1 Tax=Haloferula rosea TaxID=490093 RepID=A0A934RGG3_9BACT|nr:PEP-CTERM sorting domain-containing protein [Haloferula rosea]MBK1828746.1 PEP-CTERM sorting domain-containing protein [Haloferula rosea]
MLVPAHPASFAACCLSLFLPTWAVASTASLDFDSLQHGEEVTNQFFSSAGVTISGVDDDNAGNSLPIVAFDTEIPQPNPGTPTTSDPDLQRLGLNGQDSVRGWNGGNLGSDYIVGNALIVQENNNQNAQGIFTDPDDRAAGGIIVIDIDATNYDYRYVQTLLVDFEETGVPLFRFTDINSNVATYSPSLEFDTPDNNFLYYTPIIDTESLGLDSRLSRIEFEFTNASGAIGLLALSDDASFNGFIPEPSSALLMVMGGLVAFRRRRD